MLRVLLPSFRSSTQVTLKYASIALRLWCDKDNQPRFIHTGANSTAIRRGFVERLLEGSQSCEQGAYIYVSYVTYIHTNIYIYIYMRPEEGSRRREIGRFT